jgi:hypothetical protein
MFLMLVELYYLLHLLILISLPFCTCGFQLKLPSWQQVTAQYGKENFETRKLLDIIGTIGHVKLTAAVNDAHQGWWLKQEKNQSLEDRQPNEHISAFVSRLQNAKRLKAADATELSKLENVEQIVLGPSDHPPWTPADESKLTLHTAGECFELFTANNHLPKLQYSICIMDILYDLNDADTDAAPEKTSAEDVKHFLEHFRDCTTMDTFSVVVFCSYQQMEPVFKAVATVCNVAVERHFWMKPNCQRTPNQQAATNSVECFIVGFCGPKNSKRMPWQMNFADDDDCRNYHVIPKVMKPYYYEEQVSSTTFTTIMNISLFLNAGKWCELKLA